MSRACRPEEIISLSSSACSRRHKYARGWSCNLEHLHHNRNAGRNRNRKQHRDKQKEREKGGGGTKITRWRQDGGDRKVRCIRGGTHDKLNYFKGD